MDHHEESHRFPGGFLRLGACSRSLPCDTAWGAHPRSGGGVVAASAAGCCAPHSPGIRATRPAGAHDLPEPRIPRNLLLVRPTGKRRGRELHPPQAENHLPHPLTCENRRVRLGWEIHPFCGCRQLRSGSEIRTAR